MSIYKEPPPGMFVVPDPQDMTKVKWNDTIHAVSRIIVIISTLSGFIF